MDERFHAAVSSGVELLTLVAASLLIVGFVISTVKWIGQVVSEGQDTAYGTYRIKLGRTVLIGLELLVAATILKTIVTPATVEALSLILATVAIRTVLGWTTSLEIYGRWPWQRPDRKPQAEE